MLRPHCRPISISTTFARDYAVSTLEVSNPEVKDAL